eukprot:2927400-Amphidinium_carterae.1
MVRVRGGCCSFCSSECLDAHADGPWTSALAAPPARTLGMTWSPRYRGAGQALRPGLDPCTEVNCNDSCWSQMVWLKPETVK